MKNIHVLPTNNYSPLVHSTNKYGGYFKSEHYSPMKEMGDSYQNIYITIDEEIKEGDWVYCLTENRVLISNVSYSKLDDRFKIILTTDNDLIKDGVQAIDDEFLEWFVKNPSCEEVEVENIPNNNWGFDLEEPMNLGYKIIIPKEEPKQETLEEEFKFKNRQMGAAGFVGNKIMENMISKFKQETLEEAAENYVRNESDVTLKLISKYSFKDGTKWQAERMYSEEEVFNLCREFAIFVQRNGPSYKKQQEWFEQFKRKA